MSDSAESSQQYVDAEALLPFGELLNDIRGTEKVVRVGYFTNDENVEGQERMHHWIAHMPDYEVGDGEFLSVKIATGMTSVSHVTFKMACRHLEPPTFYEWELAVKDVVDINRTPIPYKKESTLHVECPECGRFGLTHPWKLDDYVPDECPCGYRGDWDVQ